MVELTFGIFQLEVYVDVLDLSCCYGSLNVLTHVCSGNGDLTYEESKTHFTAWALMKSPLLISMHVGSVYFLPGFLSVLTWIFR